MNLVFTDMKALFAAVKNGFAAGPKLVTIDGVSGAGQKEIAEKLAAYAGAAVLEIDESLDAAKLKDKVTAKQKRGSVVVAGVRMRAIMTAAGFTPDIEVYVVPSVKNSRRAFWEGILSKPLEEFLAELTAPLDKQTVEYHWKYHPIINADFLVEGN